MKASRLIELMVHQVSMYGDYPVMSSGQGLVAGVRFSSAEGSSEAFVEIFGLPVSEEARELSGRVRRLGEMVAATSDKDDGPQRDVRVKCEAILTRLMQVEAILGELSL